MLFLKKKEVEKVLDVEKLSKKFLDYIDVSNMTIELYRKALKQFSSYLNDNDIKNPTRENIIEWREELRSYLKANTVNSYLIAVRSFFRYLAYEGLYKNISENVKGIKLEKKHLKLGLSEEEIEKVLNVCNNDREVLIIKMMIVLGLRSNELVNIRLEDFYRDTDTIMLRVLGKARDEEKQDSIKVPQSLYESIKKYVEENNITDYLFVSDCHRNYRGQMSTSALRHLVKDIFKRADLENIDLKSTHSLRHTTTELLLKDKVDIQEVSEYMRHKSLATTMIYAKELNQKESQCSSILANKLF